MRFKKLLGLWITLIGHNYKLLLKLRIQKKKQLQIFLFKKLYKMALVLNAKEFGFMA